ncbi:polysaccharide deacetylase family protein [Deltaproteobacteria bacterium]|nr:polysaccharide deacetylase family protein [Deltaproteobacteria bacterium]
MKPKLWLTVDSDDIRHIPRHQGHPKRSKKKLAEPYQVSEPSPDLLLGMKGFSKWIDDGGSATLFVIAEQLESLEFSKWLEELLSTGRILIACHGLSHRSWSAWGEDIEGFSQALADATLRLKEFGGKYWRPWFRAPAGYIAPWMAEVLAAHEYLVDSSVNESWLTKRKTGPRNSWAAVKTAVKEAGIVEREWLINRSFWVKIPVCGPALHIPFLKTISKRSWRFVSSLEKANPIEVENADCDVVTVYWHILDHARKKGDWRPPFV